MAIHTIGLAGTPAEKHGLQSGSVIFNASLATVHDGRCSVFVTINNLPLVSLRKSSDRFIASQPILLDAEDKEAKSHGLKYGKLFYALAMC
jgi:hypothetical protein